MNDEIRKKHEAQRSYVLETQGDAAYLNQSIKSGLTISEVDALFKALDEAPAREKRLERIIEDQKDTIIAFEKSHAALKAENERLREKASRSHIQKDRDYWQKKAMDMLHGNFTQCCSYCGWEAPPPSGWDELQKHIEECPEHPLPKLRTRAEQAEAEVERLKAEKYESLLEYTALRTRAEQAEKELAAEREKSKCNHEWKEWTSTAGRTRQCIKCGQQYSWFG